MTATTHHTSSTMKHPGSRTSRVPWSKRSRTVVRRSAGHASPQGAHDCGLCDRRATRGLRFVSLRETALRPRHPASPRAFTLIEIMIVIGIISVLLSIVLAVGSVLGQNTEIKQTRSTMLILQGALDEWEKSADRQLSWGINGVPGVADGFARDAVYDLQAEEPPGSPRKHIFLLTEMLGTIGSSTAIRDLLVQIDDDRFPIYNSASGIAPEWIRNLRDRDNDGVPDAEPDPDWGGWDAEWRFGRWDGEPAVLDAWDHPIRFVHPGRLWSTDPWFDDQNNGVARHADGTILTFYEAVYGVAQNRKGYFISAGPDGEFGSVSAPFDSLMFKATRDNIYSSEVIKP